MSRQGTLVVDCDPGCDDALALLLAFHTRAYRSIDIATVAGNVGIQQTTANAARVVALAERYGLIDDETEVSIYRGAAASVCGIEPSAASVHGRDGLGDVPLRALVPSESSKAAFLKSLARSLLQGEPRQSTALYDSLQNDPAKKGHLEPSRDSLPDLLCTGPLTNLALTLLSLPKPERGRFWRKWRRAVIMAGAVDVPGNISYAAEFNAHADPDALSIVLDSWNQHFDEELNDGDPTPLVLVPLDLTEKLVLWAPEESLDDDLTLRVPLYCLLRKYFLFHAINYDPPIGRKDKDGLWTVSDVPFRYQEEHWRSDPEERRALAQTVTETYDSAQRAAKSGLKKLPRWCFLHDPAAFWILHQWEGLGVQDAWATIVRALQAKSVKAAQGAKANGLALRYVRLERAHTQSRGLVHPAEPRHFFHSEGTEARGDLSRVLAVTQGLRQQVRSGLLQALEELLAVGAPTDPQASTN